MLHVAEGCGRDTLDSFLDSLRRDGEGCVAGRGDGHVAALRGCGEPAHQHGDRVRSLPRDETHWPRGGQGAA